MSEKRTIFITGATGLLGSYLLKILLQNGHKVYALARGQNVQEASERVIKKVKFWDEKVSAKNLSVLVGDIIKENLGLDSKTLYKLKSEVDEIFHCAAVTNLNWPLDEIRKINTEGTRNILYFAEECTKTGRFIKTNHISTAYIYGSFKGVFTENDLEVGQKFNTTYEQTKFEAEKLVGAYRKKGLWIDIFRPPIIIGHSKTGKILKFKNIYQLIYLCRLGIFDYLPVINLSARIVPVDSTSEAIYVISLNTKEKNKNYHPFANSDMPVNNIIGCGCRLMGIRSPKPVSLDDPDIKKLSPAQTAILQNTLFSINFQSKLNSDYTNKILEGYNFRFPKMDDNLLADILKFFINEKHLNMRIEAR